MICLLPLWLIGLNTAMARPVSDIKADEHIQFFNTSAWMNQQTDQWHIPIHGWIYEPQDSSVRMGLIAAALESLYALSRDDESTDFFDPRINLLLADSESNKSIIIRFADRTYALPASASNGHFKATLLVDKKIIDAANIQHQLSYQAVLPEQDQRVFNGHARLLADQGLSIISDIDDTIKISKVTDRKQLLSHTFYQPFKAVPGMATLYQNVLADKGALHFVSSSPWQLYQPLLNFTQQAGFPAADYALKSFRFKDSSLMNLFASSLATKPPQIIEIIQRFPNKQFILIGDNGEQDPEVYARIQKQFPTQIIKILIRNVSEEKPSDARYQSLYKDLNPHLWQLFDDANSIKFNQPFEINTVSHSTAINIKNTRALTYEQ